MINAYPGTYYFTDIEMETAWCNVIRLTSSPGSPSYGCYAGRLGSPPRLLDWWGGYAPYNYPNYWGDGYDYPGLFNFSAHCVYGGKLVPFPVAGQPDAWVCDHDPVQPEPLKNEGEPRTCVANPINPGTGNKFQRETDIGRLGTRSLAIDRFYNSHHKLPSVAFGRNWRGGFERSIKLATSYSLTTATVQRPNGKSLFFNLTGGRWIPDTDIADQLAQLFDPIGVPIGWRYLTSDDVTETYDVAGRFVSSIDRHGVTQTLIYSPIGQLIRINDSFGRSLSITYDASSRIGKIISSASDAYSYAYDGRNNLVSVSYPDGKSRAYVYENPSYPNALTGLIDEQGNRFATWAYDAQGRAIGSEHATGSIDQYSIVYTANSSRATESAAVTDPLGTARTYTFQTILGVVKNTGVSQPGGSGCGPASSAITYDANGNVATRTDFNGNVTTYTYDLTRNLETQRVEAAGKPEQRTITTQWHPYWRQTTKIAEPKKLTTWIYNGDNGAYCAPPTATVPSIIGGTQPIGVVCGQSEQATTDLTGSTGLSATVTGSPRTWTTTYDTYGQILTANGPRTDVADVTSTTYYAADDPDLGKRGNIATVTNALGHLSRYTAYDLNGRPLAITDPNGTVTTLSYTPRGWLKTRRSNGLTSTYDYDGVGQLTAVTRPDGSKILYSYDQAHRLNSITDLKGNRIEYTLDPMGNITKTEWLNADGTPAKRQDAGFDALGRLQSAFATRDAINYATTFGYDPNGNPTTITDPRSKTTATQYDALNRPSRIIDALNGQTIPSYDGQGQLTQFKAPNNAQTIFAVDGLGNVTQEISADRGTRNSSYDAAGNRLTLADARGVLETRTYDALNRPLTVSYPLAGENRRYTWDTGTGCSNGIGRLCQITDNGGSTRFAYDTRGNLVSETRTEGGVTLPAMHYGWDSADRLVTQITPSGKTLTALRGSDGRILQVSAAVGSNPQLNLVSDIQIDAVGNTLTQTFGNGATETKTFHSDGSLSSQIDQPAVIPWFNNLGPLFDYAGLVAATPQIAWQNWAWHAITDDVDHDGDLDLMLYFNGNDENFKDIACTYDCGDWYMGPDFGVLVYLENVGGSYVRRPFSTGQDLIPGDIEQMIWLDYNNDGKTDLLLVLNQASTSSRNQAYYSGKPYHRLVLMKNDSGPAFAGTGNPNGTHFSDVTVAAGLSQTTWSAEGLVLDLNGDGYPDILGVSVDANYAVLGDAFVYNSATGTYQASTTSGLPRSLWVSSLADLDGDGKPDLVAQDDTAGLRFFRNLGNSSFAELTNTQDLSGLVGRWIVKLLPADMDNDGKTDLVSFETDHVGSYPDESYNGARIRLLRNGGIVGNQITFTEQAAAAFAPNGHYNEIAFGGTVGDVNNDGLPDVVLAAADHGSRLAMADGSGGYQLPEAAGTSVGLAGPGSRFAEPVMVDFNGDGKADLLGSESTDTINSGNYLLRNSGSATGTRHGLSVELTGQNRAAAPSSGKDAFGARVEVSAGGRTLTRQVLPAMGLSRRLHFGLGDVTSGIQIKIYWPDNPTPQVLSGDPYVDAILRVSQP